MNNPKSIQEILILVMRVTFTQLLIMIAMSTLVFAADLKGQEILDRKISLAVDNQEIRSVLRELERQAAVHFTYQSRQIHSSRKITLEVEEIALKNVLQEMFSPEVKFEVVGDEIVLKPAPKEQALVAYDSPFFIYELTVSGVVTDDKGSTLPGVNIIEKGTTNGTTSDANGKFSLSVADENSILVFSFIGFQSQEVPVGSNTVLNVSLQPDVKSLDEVVVIAYGTRSKKDLTGAVSYIGTEEISRSVALSPQNAMRGTMPGVFVSAQSGDPNARPIVRVRGVSTFSADSDPLYVVDGVPINDYGDEPTFHDPQKITDIRGSQNIFNLINPNDIASISVLKDASSAAAYGTRAANGVVLITTKKGGEGKLRVNVSASAGITNVQKKLDILDTEGYVEFVTRTHENDPVWINPFGPGVTDNDRAIYTLFQPDSAGYLGNSPTYDWQDAVINKNGRIEDYNFSVSGGNANANYYFGGGYAYQESNVKFNNQKRYSATVRTEFKIGKIFEVGQTLRLGVTDLLDNRDNTGVPINLYNVAFRTAPFQPIYDPAGRRGYQETDATRFATGAQNWVAMGGAFTNSENTTVKMLGNVYGAIKPFKGFKITGTVGVDYFTNRREGWSLGDTQYFIGGGSSTGENTYGVVDLSNFTLIKRLTAEYDFLTNGHSFNIYAHAESQQFGFESIDSRRGNIQETDDPDNFILTGNISTSSYFEDRAWINYLGRVSYKYNDKYYVDVTVLRQASSILAPDHRWGYFPSVAVAWRISQENFMANQNFFDDLKLKAGAGELGNSAITPFQYQSLIETRYPSYLTGNNNVTIGSFVQNFPNVELGWERLLSYNVGFESIIKGNFAFSAEYYYKETKDVLQRYALPSTTGFTSDPFKNIGAVTNQGVELALGYEKTFGEVNLRASVNFTTNNNKITQLDGNLPYNIANVGFVVLNDPFNSIYGFKTAGVIKTQEELDAYKDEYGDSEYVSQLQLGDLMYRDVAGAPTADDVEAGRRNNPNPDGKIDAFDGTVRIGRTTPGHYYGINLGADFKAFDISILFQGVGDVQRENVLRREGLYAGGYNNKLREVLDSWTPENADSDLPRINTAPGSASAANNGRFSDRWVEDAGFLRLANVQIGYNFSKTLLAGSNIFNTARLFVSASNLFTITNYTGYDPENDLVPPARIVMAGINLGF